MTTSVSSNPSSENQPILPKEGYSLPHDTNTVEISKLAYQKILEKYQESPHEPEFSEEAIDEIYGALDKVILPMSKDSVFYDTDLILITDSFTGNMPLNGIKKKELEHAEKLFKKICDGKQKIKIITSDLSFKNDIEQSLKKLLTRNIGRKLIQKVISNHVINQIEIVAGERFCLSKFSSTGCMILTVNTGVKNRMLAYHPSGKLKSQLHPLYISLAHELVHASHVPHTVENEPPTFSIKYDNLEEQWTITGLKRDLFFESNEITWDDLDTLKQELDKIYDELNEWNFSAAFSNSQNIYYPRFSHRSMPVKDSINEKIEYLALSGLLFDLENLDEELKNYKATSAFNPLIFFAVESGQVNVVRFLMDKGFDVGLIHWDNNALHDLFHKMGYLGFDYCDMVKFLIDNGVSLFLSTEDKGTPIHQLICYDRLEKLNAEENRPFTKLILNEILMDFDLDVLFDLIRDTESSNEAKIKFGEILWECSYEILEKRLTEIHDVTTRETLYQRFDKIISKLTTLGASTPIKQDCTLEDLLKNWTKTAWAMKLFSEKNLIEDLGNFRTEEGNNLLHNLVTELKMHVLDDDYPLWDLHDYILKKYPDLLDTPNNSNITPRQIRDE